MDGCNSFCLHDLLLNLNERKVLSTLSTSTVSQRNVAYSVIFLSLVLPYSVHETMKYGTSRYDTAGVQNSLKVHTDRTRLPTRFCFEK